MNTINMLGKPCPIPVVEAKKALLQPGVQGVIVLVDNSIAVQNLQKMANGLGYDFSFEQKSETEYAVTITKQATKSSEQVTGNSEQGKGDVSNPATLPNSIPHSPLPTPHSPNCTFLFTADQIGIGAEEPSKKLMKSFLYSLTQLPSPPSVVLLLNTGVRMAADGSDTLEDLKTLAGRGTDVRSCGQCLNYYGLTEKLAVGSITNMMDIVETLTSSARTITM